MLINTWLTLVKKSLQKSNSRRPAKESRKRSRSVASTQPAAEMLETRALLSATGFMEDFSAGTLPGNLERSGNGLTAAPVNGSYGGSVFENGYVRFTGEDTRGDASGGLRTFLRTVDDDYSSVDFVAEVTVTIFPNNGSPNLGRNIAFFGLGTAESSTFGEPNSAGIRLNVTPTNFHPGLSVVDGGSNGGSLPGAGGDGTYRLRMVWSACDEMAIFQIDKNYAGGAFVADYTLGTIDGSDNGFNATNARLFIGGDWNTRFDDFSVVVSEPACSVPTVAYGESSVGFGSLSNGVPNISGTDLANGIAPSELNTNTIGLGYGVPATLTDGLPSSGESYIPTNDYQFNSVSVNNDAIVQIDLGSSKQFTQINTYSEAFAGWLNDRVWQGYKVYGSNTNILVNQAANDTTAELASNSDLTLLGQVNTVPFQDGVNEKYIGVSVSGNWSSYRYVIFDFQSPYELGYRTGDTSFFGINNGQETARRYTRFREIDIVNTQATVSIGDASVTEGNSDTTVLSFPVTLSNPVDVAVSVDYKTQDGTATAGSDYVVQTGTLTIPAGSTTGTIDITVNGDTAVELDDTLSVLLSNVQASGRDVQLQGSQLFVDFNGTGLAEGTSITNQFAGFTVTDGLIARPGGPEFGFASPAGSDQLVSGQPTDGDFLASKDYFSTTPLAITFDNTVSNLSFYLHDVDESSPYVIRVFDSSGLLLSTQYRSIGVAGSNDGTTTLVEFPISNIKKLVITPTQLSGWGLDNLKATLSVSATGTIVNDDFNTPPAITSGGGGDTASVNAAENQLAVTDVQATDDNDAEGTGLVYSLSGGADQASFSIDANTGVLTFNTTPDFEDPADADSDNVYEVQVTVTDSGSLTDVQDIAVTVTDINEAPSVALINTTNSLVENTDTSSPVKVADIVVTDDALGTNTLSLSGIDAVMFEISGAELFLKAGSTVDFETNSILDVTVEVDDSSVGATPDDSAALVINVIDVAPVQITCEVIDDMQALKDAGRLGNGQVNPIINHLSQAKASLAKGKITHAIKKLEQARDEIQKLIDGGGLDAGLESQLEALVNSLNDVLTEIQSGSM